MTEMATTDTVELWRAGHVADPRHLAPPLTGARYLRLIEAAHRELRPQVYFEIGTQKGFSLALATCRAVAVDPKFLLPPGFMENRQHVRLFETTSDAFFETQDLTHCCGAPVDLAFLDGMHRFEYLLRDFLNTEPHCGADSVIMLHDCVPVSSEIVYRRQRAPRRSAFDVLPHAWAGDVWKLLPILQEHRPDLRLTVFDAAPTGLVFVTGLDPRSMVLRERYDEIVVRYMNLDLVEEGVSAFVGRQHLRPTSEGLAPGRLRSMIGLAPPAPAAG